MRVLSYFLSYMSVEIKKVVSRSDLRKFIRFNYHLYRDNNYSVPELYPDMVNTLSKTRNPAFEFCEADYFLAYKGGRLVGRVAAIINGRANDRWNVRAVRFGWIDFIDDTEVSEALISAVAKWGKERGMTQITGPLGFTDFDPEGTLVEGFDQLGTMSTTYNYPYYASHFERLGFIKDADWVEYKVYVPDAIPEKHLRISDVVKRKYGLQVRKYKSARRLVNDYGQKIFDLMNVAYKDLYGYTRPRHGDTDNRGRRHSRRCGHHHAVALARPPEGQRASLPLRLVASAEGSVYVKTANHRLPACGHPSGLSGQGSQCAAVLRSHPGLPAQGSQVCRDQSRARHEPQGAVAMVLL